MQMESIWWECKLNLPRLKKPKKQKWRKNTKIEENWKWRKGKSCLEKGAKTDINDLHENLGHPAEEIAKLTGNYMKLSSRGKMDNCKNCIIAKMWQKNVEKAPQEYHQNWDFVFTSTLHYQNLLVLEDQNIGFWQWMRPHIWKSVCS